MNDVTENFGHDHEKFNEDSMKNVDEAPMTAFSWAQWALIPWIS